MATEYQPPMNYDRSLLTILLEDLGESEGEESPQCQAGVTEGETSTSHTPTNDVASLFADVNLNDTARARRRLDALTTKDLLAYIIAHFKTRLNGYRPRVYDRLIRHALGICELSARCREAVIAYLIEAIRKARVESGRLDMSTQDGIHDWRIIIDFWAACVKTHRVILVRPTRGPISRAEETAIISEIEDVATFVKSNLMSLPGTHVLVMIGVSGELRTKEDWERRLVVTLIAEVELLRGLS